MAKAPKKGSKWVVRSQKQVVEFFQVSPKTVESWRAAGMPGDSKKRRYDLSEIAVWLRNRPAEVARRKKREPLGEAEEGSPEDYERRYLIADTKLKEEQARKVRVFNERQDGLLMSIQEVHREFFARALALNTTTDTLPLLADEIIQMEEVEEIRDRLERQRVYILNTFCSGEIPGIDESSIDLLMEQIFDTEASADA